MVHPRPPNPPHASSLDDQRADDPWDERTAPHAARAGPPNRGHPAPASPHAVGDRHAAHPGHGGRHVEPRDKKKANKKLGGAGWVGPEKGGEAERVDEVAPVQDTLDEGDPAWPFEPPGGGAAE